MKNKIIIIIVILLWMTNVSLADFEVDEILTLKEAIEIALENSQSLKQAENLYQQQQSLLEIYQAKYNHNYNFLISNNYSLYAKENQINLNRLNLNDQSNLHITKEISPVNRLRLEQNLLSYDDGFNFLETGSIRYEHDIFREHDTRAEYQDELFARKIFLVEQEQEIDRLKTDLKYKVIKKYYKLLELKENKKAYEKSLEQAKQTLEIVESEFEIGEASNLDKQTAELEVDNRKLELSRLNSEYKLAVLDLADLLKKELTTEISLAEKKDLEFDYSKLELLEIAKKNSFQLKVLQEEIDRQEEKITYLTGKSNFALTGLSEFSWSDEEFIDDYQIGVEFNYNFSTFKSKLDKNKINHQKIQLAQLKSEQAEIKENLESKLRREYLQLKNYQQENDFIVQKIDNQKQALEMTQKRYERGLITIEDLVAQQLELLEKEIEQANNFLAYNLQIYNIKKLIGELGSIN